MKFKKLHKNINFNSALIKAKESFNHGEVPVGAVVVKDGEIIREARELAFELVKLDPTLSKSFNRDIKEIFAKKYSHNLENLKLI